MQYRCVSCCVGFDGDAGIFAVLVVMLVSMYVVLDVSMMKSITGVVGNSKCNACTNSMYVDRTCFAPTPLLDVGYATIMGSVHADTVIMFKETCTNGTGSMMLSQCVMMFLWCGVVVVNEYE